MNTIYLVDGKPHRICDCPKLEGKCPRGVERTLQTTQLSQCFVPAPDVLIAGSAVPEALHIDEDAIQQVMWAVFSYADRREAFDKIADGPHSEARDIARESMRVQDEYIRSLLRKLASVPSPLGTK